MPEPTQVRREAARPPQRLALTPRSYDAENHTVELVAATGFKVRRYDYQEGTPYFEQLLIEDSAIDRARVDAGVCPVLDTHSRWSMLDQLGVVSDLRVEKGALILPIKFGTSAEAVRIEADVAAGIVKGVSVGYSIQEIRKQAAKDGELPTYVVSRWALLEVSFVPVPADPDAGVRSSEDGGLHPCVIIESETPKEARHMPAIEQTATPPAPPVIENRNEPAPAAPAAAPLTVDATAVRMDSSEALTFSEDARLLGVDDTQVRTWATTLTPDGARQALVRFAADKQRGQAPEPVRAPATITEDVRDKQRAAMSEALLHRHNPKFEIKEGGREWRGMSLLEMGRMQLEANGLKTRGMSKRELAAAILGNHSDGSRMHSTSDFPAILSNVAGKTLRGGYEASPQTFKAWQRRAVATDFKQITRLQMGGAPSFLLVPEGGQFKQGTIGEGKEVYALATYGRIFAVTRQTLINDDLDAFTRIPSMWGRAAADFESDVAYAPLIANPNMGDGNALFSSAHGNLAGSGGAIGETAVQAGEIAMSNQKGIEGRPARSTPTFMITGARNKVPAQKFLTAVLAAQTSNVNVYAGSMTPIVEPRLNRTSGAEPWFMAADPDQVDTIEYAYLEGDDGVFLEERVGFEVDGIEYKARLDFASKAIDYRGLYQDPGI